MNHSEERRITISRHRRTVYMKETLPIQAYYRQNCTKLDNECKRMHELITLRNAQEVLRDNHMSCRRNREELRKSLHN
jgi:hypothetical protein